MNRNCLINIARFVFSSSTIIQTFLENRANQAARHTAAPANQAARPTAAKSAPAIPAARHAAAPAGRAVRHAAAPAGHTAEPARRPWYIERAAMKEEDLSATRKRARGDTLATLRACDQIKALASKALASRLMR